MGTDFGKKVINTAEKIFLQSSLQVSMAKETLDGPLTRDMIEVEICRRLQDNVYDEYLVDGAVLTCSKATWDDFDLSDGDKITLYGIKEEIKKEKPTGELRVLENPLSEDGLYHGTVKDAVLKQNIFPFQCNCSVPATMEEEQTIKANIKKCREAGVCQYLMDLEANWENINFNVPYASFSDTDQSYSYSLGIDFLYKSSTEEAEGIMMTSVLFCKHGGFIYPITSGQDRIIGDIVDKESAFKILEQYLKEGNVENKWVKAALLYLANQSDYQMPEYESDDEKNNYDYNKYDDYIIGWVTYYNEYLGAKFDPAYIKAQCYKESKCGETTKNENVLTTNPHRDIMQALDVKNPNIFDYVWISTDKFLARTISEEIDKKKIVEQDGDIYYISGTYLWEFNHDDLEKEPHPNGEPGIEGKKDRCGGLVATLFTENRDGSGNCFSDGSEGNYYYRDQDVTPEMSIGIAMDSLYENLQNESIWDYESNSGNYRMALYKYNHKTDDYYNDIMELGKEESPVHPEGKYD